MSGSKYSTRLTPVPWQGKWPFAIGCSAGKYVNKFDVRTGSRVDNIQLSCNDNSIKSAGGPGGSNTYTIDSKFKGFHSLSGTGFNGGQTLQSFNGYGYTGNNGNYDPDVYNWICPKDQVVVGIDGGTDSNVITSLNVVCDYPEDYCINNLESPYCKDLVPSSIILNKACAKNMTQTCIDRQTELNDTVVSDYCEKNKDDPFCACYHDQAPAGIPAEIAGLPQCWSKKCATHGYKPHTLQSCPTVTVCKQELSIAGSNNIIQSDKLQVIDCHPTIVAAPTTVNSQTAQPTGGGSTTYNPSSGLYNTSNNTPISSDKAPIPTSTNKSSYILILSLLLILIGISGFVYFAKQDKTQIPNTQSTK